MLVYSPGARGDHVKLRQASSIFLDACFILQWFQKDDLCSRLFDESIDKNSSYYINPIVHSEVLHVLLRSSMILDGYYFLKKQPQKIISSYSARIFADKFRKNDLKYIESDQINRVYFDWQTIKRYLGTENGKQHFAKYYEVVNKQVDEFLDVYEVKIIELDYNAYAQVQQVYTTYLLDGADSYHYVSYKLGPLGANGKRKGSLDYLFTLDGDFERVTGPGTIIKVAS